MMVVMSIGLAQTDDPALLRLPSSGVKAAPVSGAGRRLIRRC